MDYGKRQLRNDDYAFLPGDEMYVQLGTDLDGVLTAYYMEYVRTKPLLILLGLFVLATILLGRWKGVGSLLALAFTMVVIVGYMVPHILAGEDPLRVSLIGSIIMLGTTLYLTYGWNLKTHASVLSVVLALFLTGILSIFFVALTRLTGSGEESSLFLIQFSTVTINLRGLLLGGLLIGALEGRVPAWGFTSHTISSPTAITDGSCGVKARPNKIYCYAAGKTQGIYQ